MDIGTIDINTLRLIAQGVDEYTRQAVERMKAQDYAMVCSLDDVVRVGAVESGGYAMTPRVTLYVLHAGHEEDPTLGIFSSADAAMRAAESLVGEGWQWSGEWKRDDRKVELPDGGMDKYEGWWRAGRADNYQDLFTVSAYELDRLDG